MAKCLWNEFGYEYSEQEYKFNSIIQDTRSGKKYQLTGIDSNERTYFIESLDDGIEQEVKWHEIYEYFDVIDDTKGILVTKLQTLI